MAPAAVTAQWLLAELARGGPTTEFWRSFRTAYDGMMLMLWERDAAHTAAEHWQLARRSRQHAAHYSPEQRLAAHATGNGGA
jgi:hypothetical protein